MTVEMDQNEDLTLENSVAEIQQSNEALKALIADLEQEDETQRLQSEQDLREAGYIEGHWQNGDELLNFWAKAQNIVRESCVSALCLLCSNKDLGGAHQTQPGPGSGAPACTEAEGQPKAPRRRVSIIPQRASSAQ